MITYSQRDMQHQLIADPRLWRRFPGAAAAVLWPLEAVLLGWETSRWLGPATIVAAALLSELLPRRLRVSIYLVDLLDRFLRLPLAVAWLALVWYLSAREPILALLGSPFIGAVLTTGFAWLIARVLILATRLIAPRIPALGNAGGA